MRRQLDDAVAAHTKLMAEYVALTQKNANAEADIELLSAEVSSLRNELSAQKEGVHAAADDKLKEKALEIQSLRQQVEELAKEKSKLADRLESSVAALAAAQTSREALQVASTGPDGKLIEANETIKTFKARHAENLATIAKLTREIDDLRLKEEKASTENANRLHKVMQEALAANESVIQKVTQDLMSSKTDLSRQFEHERESLMQQIQRLSDDLKDVRSEKEQTERKLTEYIDQLEATNEKLRLQKDELQSEAKFQLEIISELKSEKSSLAAEATFLRDTMTSVTLHPYRDNGMSLIRPSLVNVSHNREGQYAQAEAENLDSGNSPASPAPFAATRETLSEQQLKAQVKALTEAMDESATKLQSATFEAAELRKQLARVQDSLKDRDSDLREAQATIETMEKKLENQKQYTAAAQKDLETLESKLQEQTSELKARLESSNQQNKDILEQNAAMREKSDATDIAMREMEQALSDALSELEELRQQKEGEQYRFPQSSPSQSLSNSAGPDRLVVSLSSTQVQPPVPAEAPPPPAAAPAMELSEARELVESFAKEPKAMRALSFAQRRMRSKSETQGSE